MSSQSVSHIIQPMQNWHHKTKRPLTFHFTFPTTTLCAYRKICNSFLSLLVNETVLSISGRGVRSHLGLILGQALTSPHNLWYAVGEKLPTYNDVYLEFLSYSNNISWLYNFINISFLYMLTGNQVCLWNSNSAKLPQSQHCESFTALT